MPKIVLILGIFDIVEIMVLTVITEEIISPYPIAFHILLFYNPTQASENLSSKNLRP